MREGRRVERGGGWRGGGWRGEEGVGGRRVGGRRDILTQEGCNVMKGEG